MHPEDYDDEKDKQVKPGELLLKKHNNNHNKAPEIRGPNPQGIERDYLKTS